MKKKGTKKNMLISDILLFVCVCMLLYPLISDIWNERSASRLCSDYQEKVKDIPDNDYSDILEEAEKYNRELAEKQGKSRFRLSKVEEERYMNTLVIPGTDVMGYLDIPKLGISHMPIYHTTSQSTLQAGIGHMEGSSFPIGGIGTHTVLSGHTGMPGNRMFSELGRLEKGDTFCIRSLGEKLTYQVDHICVVLPDELSGLNIDAGHDYCTLVTCTPMGINSHRLLVRGTRIPNETLKEETESQSLIQKFLKYISEQFTVYEIIMITAAVLIFIVFLIPDVIRTLRKEYAHYEPKD